MFVLSVIFDTVTWLTVMDLCWLHWREKQNGWIPMKGFFDANLEPWIYTSSTVYMEFVAWNTWHYQFYVLVYEDF
jgi:hypothetical protein